MKKQNWLFLCIIIIIFLVLLLNVVVGYMQRTTTFAPVQHRPTQYTNYEHHGEYVYLPEDECVEHEEECIYTLHIKANAHVKTGKCMIFFHASAGNIYHYETLVELALAAGCDIMLVEYRGFSRATKIDKITPNTILHDGITAYNHLCTMYDESDIIVAGHSIGGYPTSWLMRYRNPHKSILMSTFESFRRMFDEYGMYSYVFKPFLFEKIGFENISISDNLKYASCPTFILHSETDELFSMEHVAINRRSLAHAGCKVTVGMIGGGHATPVVSNKCRSDFVNWLRQGCGPLSRRKFNALTSTRANRLI